MSPDVASFPSPFDHANVKSPTLSLSETTVSAVELPSQIVVSPVRLSVPTDGVLTVTVAVASPVQPLASRTITL